MSSSSRHKPTQSTQDQEQTSNESKIYAWTLSDASIAPCLVRDALSMPESGVEGMDYFWLGRVPCRTVLLIGLLVGVTVYESRILYTLDDGTSVVDCVHRPPGAQKRDKNTVTLVPPKSLKPIAGVGTTVRITGKVKQWHDTRQVLISNIERCSSANEEPQHWVKVANLHKTHYDLDEPFNVPSIASPDTAQDLPPAKPPIEAPILQVSPPSSIPKAQPIEFIDLTNISPSRSESVPLLTCEEPVCTPETSSNPRLPPKLRHPSRIPTAKLTDNTFRIYLKYYMDNVCYSPIYPRSSEGSGPNPQSLRAPPLDPDDVQAFMASMQGFTMSYLRRVPELALLARRVVIAESKRRIREERRKEKEKGGDLSSLKPKSVKPENYAQKTKRLFRWAIVKLYEDGSVVQWDGRRAALPDPDLEIEERSRLWQSQSENSSTTTSSLSSISLNGAMDEGELSDPEPNEEAHIPLTTEYLAIVARTAIRAMDRGSLRHLHNDTKKPLTQRRGYTPREVAKFLNRHDERWRHVGEWGVEEALKLMQKRNGVDDVGGGRWELCL